jgi:hypothetical protein
MANGNGKAQAAAARAAEAEEVDQSWEDLKKQITETSKLIGMLIFTPFILFMGCAYGLRAGIITALRKTLEMMRAWNR